MSASNKEPRTGTFLGVPYVLGSAGGTRMTRAYSRRGHSAGVTPLTLRGCFGADARAKPFEPSPRNCIDPSEQVDDQRRTRCPGPVFGTDA